MGPLSQAVRDDDLLAAEQLTTVERWRQLGLPLDLVGGIVGRRDGPDHQVHPPDPSDAPADPDDLTHHPRGTA